MSLPTVTLLSGITIAVAACKTNDEVGAAESDQAAVNTVSEWFIRPDLTAKQFYITEDEYQQLSQQPNGKLRYGALTRVLTHSKNAQ
ncbi:unnamed protein product [Didymodactylos carnosus]|uniref:Uncharacterized protein n=1 Tax=Didymodactylos carnosus TaxID=1234261 RepID=A0A8S2EU74_9BILA|nr:unnamed protein product [Didymodactylos carnosus]CAF4068372.1 unnamed protein product [Didymodactylos carnosus]